MNRFNTLNKYEVSQYFSDKKCTQKMFHFHHVFEICYVVKFHMLTLFFFSSCPIVHSYIFQRVFKCLIVDFYMGFGKKCYRFWRKFLLFFLNIKLKIDLYAHTELRIHI